MNPNLKPAIVVGAYVGVVGVAAVLTIKDIKKQQKARAAIASNASSDIAAILKASKHVQKRIDAGHIHNLNDLNDALENEIAFQKIAIREEVK